MIHEPLEESYFKWLASQVADPDITNPARTHWALLRQLFTKEFVWLVPNDDNRVEDGRALRYEFLEENHGLERDQVDPDWIGQGCAVLEMLIGLSRRLSFDADEGEPHDWFWILLDHVEIGTINDKVYKRTRGVEDRIDEVLDRIIWRTYEPTGQGGLFPLKFPEKDQRKVELWYQANAYLLENHE